MTTRRDELVFIWKEIRGALEALRNARDIKNDNDRASHTMFHEKSLVRLTTIWKNLSNRTWEDFDPEKND